MRRAEEQALEQGLREILGGRRPPDVTHAVLERAATWEERAPDTATAARAGAPELHGGARRHALRHAVVAAAGLVLGLLLGRALVPLPAGMPARPVRELATGAPFSAARTCTLRLPSGASLVAQQGARLVVWSAERVVLQAGTLTVRAPDTWLEVTTPLGRVSGGDCTYDITLTEEDDPVKATTTATAAASLSVGVALGAVLFHGSEKAAGPGDLLAEAPQEIVVRGAGSDDEAPTADLPEPIATQPFGIRSAARTREEMVRRIAELERHEGRLTEENARLRQQIEALVGREKLTPDALRNRLMTLAASGGDDAADEAWILAAIKLLGNEGLDVVLDALKADDVAARRTAARLLQSLDDPRAIPALTRAALDDTDIRVRHGAARALSELDDPAAIPALWDLYRQSEKTSQEAVLALTGLSLHADPQGLETTVDAVRNPGLLGEARWALTGLLHGNAPHLMPVAEALEHELARNENRIGLLPMVINYYQRIATPEATARLHALATDPTLPDWVRTQAAAALSR